MDIVDLDAIPQVALGFMNDDHEVEARLLNDLAEAVAALRDGSGNRDAVLRRFTKLDEHTREHFAREEEAMEQVGFPPFPVHKGEHDRVLAELAEEGRRFVETGDVDRLWTYVTEAVPAWFTAHILSMDAVTAQFVQRAGA